MYSFYRDIRLTEKMALGCDVNQLWIDLINLRITYDDQRSLCNIEELRFTLRRLFLRRQLEVQKFLDLVFTKKNLDFLTVKIISILNLRKYIKHRKKLKLERIVHRITMRKIRNRLLGYIKARQSNI